MVAVGSPAGQGVKGFCDKENAAAAAAAAGKGYNAERERRGALERGAHSRGGVGGHLIPQIRAAGRETG